MSVKKLDFEYIRQSHKSFTTNLNEVIQNIHDGFILGLFVYLSSLPPEWKVNRAHLMKHFSVGRDKINKSLKWLCDNNLIEYEQKRDEKGVFGDSGIVVNEGIKFIQKLVIHNETHINTTSSTATLKIRATDNPCNGKSVPIKEIAFKKENKYKKDFPVDNFKGKRQCGNTGELKCLVPEWAPGHPGYDSVHGIKH